MNEEVLLSFLFAGTLGLLEACFPGNTLTLLYETSSLRSSFYTRRPDVHVMSSDQVQDGIATAFFAT